MHWAFWMIVGGLGVDLIDTFTTKKGDTGGIFYGATGVLKGVNFPYGKFTIGEGVAIIGAVILFIQHPKGIGS